MIISIIIPLYNLENYIDKLLRSLENQTLSKKKFEVIVIDDGSIDRSLEVVKKYSKKSNLNLRIFSKKNGGVSSARNLGIKKSTGKYLYFLDGDDNINNFFLELIKDEIEISNPDLILTNYYEIRGRNLIKNKVDKSLMGTTKEFLINYIKGKIPANMCTFIFRKKLIDKLKLFFNENTHYGEDLEFYQKFMLSSQKIKFIEGAIFYYVYRCESAMNGKRGKRRLDALKAILRVRKSMEKTSNQEMINLYNLIYIPSHILQVFFKLVMEKSYKEAVLLSKNNLYREYMRISRIEGKSKLKINLLYYTPIFYIFLLKVINKVRDLKNYKNFT